EVRMIELPQELICMLFASEEDIGFVALEWAQSGVGELITHICNACKRIGTQGLSRSVENSTTCILGKFIPTGGFSGVAVLNTAITFRGRSRRPCMRRQ